MVCSKHNVVRVDPIIIIIVSVLTSSAMEWREDEREDGEEQVEEWRARATVGVGTRSFFLDPSWVEMGVKGRGDLAPPLAGWVEARDLLRGTGEAGVTVDVLRGMWGRDFLAKRGVATFSLSLDLGVPSDFLFCSKQVIVE